jgi:hypothetical protein
MLAAAADLEKAVPRIIAGVRTLQADPENDEAKMNLRISTEAAGTAGNFHS